MVLVQPDDQSQTAAASVAELQAEIFQPFV